MEKIIGWIKSHPWGAAGIGLGALVVFWFLFGRSSGGAQPNVAADYYGAQSAASQAAAATNIAQNQSNNQLSALLDQDRTALQMQQSSDELHANEITTLANLEATITQAQSSAAQYSSLYNLLGEQVAGQYAIEQEVAIPGSGQGFGDLGLTNILANEFATLKPPAPTLPHFSPPPAQAA